MGTPQTWPHSESCTPTRATPAPPPFALWPRPIMSTSRSLRLSQRRAFPPNTSKSTSSARSRPLSVLMVTLSTSALPLPSTSPPKTKRPLSSARPRSFLPLVAGSVLSSAVTHTTRRALMSHPRPLSRQSVLSRSTSKTTPTLLVSVSLWLISSPLVSSPVVSNFSSIRHGALPTLTSPVGTRQSTTSQSTPLLLTHSHSSMRPSRTKPQRSQSSPRRRPHQRLPLSQRLRLLRRRKRRKSRRRQRPSTPLSLSPSQPSLLMSGSVNTPTATPLLPLSGFGRTSTPRTTPSGESTTSTTRSLPRSS